MPGSATSSATGSVKGKGSVKKTGSVTKKGSVTKGPGTPDPARTTGKGATTTMILLGVTVVAIVAVSALIYAFTRPVAEVGIDDIPPGHGDVGQMKRAIGHTTDCFTGNGKFYVGTIRRTAAGTLCQRWASNRPNRHRFKARAFGGRLALLRASNYCRNPAWRAGVKYLWCINTRRVNGRYWGKCAVQACPENYVKDDVGNRTMQKPISCLTGNGKWYNGTMSKTVSGFDCKRWDSKLAGKVQSKNFEHLGITKLSDLKNYCRNPDYEMGGTFLWCYSTNPNRVYEACKVKKCSGKDHDAFSDAAKSDGFFCITLSPEVCAPYQEIDDGFMKVKSRAECIAACKDRKECGTALFTKRHAKYGGLSECYMFEPKCAMIPVASNVLEYEFRALCRK